MLGQLDFFGYIVNSAIVGVGSTALSLVLGVPFAYALARLPIPKREWWARGVLFTRMVPAVALVVPMFVLFNQLHLTGTYFALVAAHTTFNLPIVIWMMRSFFEDLPIELEEAAMVDGASRFGAFWRVALPLTSSGHVGDRGALHHLQLERVPLRARPLGPAHQDRADRRRLVHRHRVRRLGRQFGGGHHRDDPDLHPRARAPSGSWCAA